MPGPFRKDAQHVYHAIPWLEFEWLDHGFGTRLSTEWNQQQPIATLKQVHSDVCLWAERGEGRVGEGDALITGLVGARVGVRTADCVPILLADTRTRAVAAIHAGWRGTVQRIVSKAVDEMKAKFSTSPRDVVAAIGPAIGPCCYQVGAEVAVLFRDWFPERNDFGGPAHLDLAEANRRQLLSADVAAERIWVAEVCTCCQGEEFFSWRRELQRTGRMLNAAGIRQE